MARPLHSTNWRSRSLTLLIIAGSIAGAGNAVRGELPSPELRTVFPTGGRAGSVIEVAVEGGQLDEASGLRLSDPRLSAVALGKNQFQLTIPRDVRPGVYDLRVVGKFGVSAPRAFVISSLDDQLEVEPNDAPDQAMSVALDQALHGKLDKPGDVDHFRFTARRDQRVLVDLWAERVDSPVQAILEIFDTTGKRLNVNRGRQGRDPAIDFVAPADGEYRVRVCDQTFVGGAGYLYRLELDTTPRVETAFPCVVTAGEPTTLTLLGRNLIPHGTAATGTATTIARSVDDALEKVEVNVPAFPPTVSPAPTLFNSAPLSLRSYQSAFTGLAYYHSDRCLPIPLGVTDIPVVRESTDNHRAESAQPLTVPCEVSGRLAEGDEQDWYRVVARKGDVLWIDTLGARIGAPVDLDVVVLDMQQRELAHFTDQVENLGGTRFPTNHPDAAGRFVVPADGAYLIMVRNLIGDLASDPRRIYRLSVRREEPDFTLVALARRSDQPSALNVWRGGREVIEILVERRRGLHGPIRISAEDLPVGLDCPNVWVGPDEQRALVVVTADRGMRESVGTLKLVGRADVGGQEVVRPVRGGSMVRAGALHGWGRLTADFPVGVVQEAPLTVHAAVAQSNHFQGSIVDVAINVERRDGTSAALQLSGMGLPRWIENSLQSLPAGATSGWLSFYLPNNLPPGPYSFAIQVETEATVNGQKTPVTACSNSLTLNVEPGRIHVSIDPRTPRKIARGEVIHVKYRAERQHGFIGKIHTELAAPGGVTGIRGRGVTFTGLTDSGDIQVIATENAEPGQLLFLRLEAVGTVEDQPIYRGSRFLELEITK